jgi:hypothetical protein
MLFLIRDLQESGLDDEAVASMLDRCRQRFEEGLKANYLCPCAFFGMVMYTAVDGRPNEAMQRADQWLSNGDASSIFREDNPVLEALVDQPGWGQLLERNREQLARQRNIYFSGSP